MATTKPRSFVPQITVQYEDAPMHCCGVGQGSHLTEDVYTGEYVENRWAKGVFDREFRTATKGDVVARLRALKERAEQEERNVVMITLTDKQERLHQAITAAKEERFRVIQEFYNPNTGNQVSIMTYTQYENFAEYSAAVGGEDEE